MSNQDVDNKVLVNQGNKPDPALILQLLAIFGSVAFFAMIAYSLRNQPQTTPLIWGVFFAFATSVITERIKQLADYLSSQKTKEETSKAIGDIAQRIENSSDIIHIGLTKDAVKVMHEAMEGGAISIMDTFFRVRTNTSYEMQNGDTSLFVNAMKKLLDRGGKYVCIGNSIGINSSLLSRAAQKNTIEPNQYKNLIIKCIECNVPVTNYVVIEYTNGLEEGYFGWDFNDTVTCHIFLSRNTKIVAFFKSQFMVLDSLTHEQYKWA